MVVANFRDRPATPNPPKKLISAYLSLPEKGKITVIGFEDQQQVADGAFGYVQGTSEKSTAHPGVHNWKYGLGSFKIREKMPLRLKAGDGGIDGQHGKVLSEATFIVLPYYLV